jgi:hypothetical protein
VTVCVPTVNVVTLLLVAVPPLSVTGVPRVAPSTLNWTVPVAPAGLTVAVKVTPWPKVEGLADEATVVVLAAWFTCWVTVPLLGLKLPPPPYSAVMTWLPAVREAVV